MKQLFVQSYQNSAVTKMNDYKQFQHMRVEVHIIYISPFLNDESNDLLNAVFHAYDLIFLLLEPLKSSVLYGYSTVELKYPKQISNEWRAIKRAA